MQHFFAISFAQNSGLFSSPTSDLEPEIDHWDYVWKGFIWKGWNFRDELHSLLLDSRFQWKSKHATINIKYWIGILITKIQFNPSDSVLVSWKPSYENRRPSYWFAVSRWDSQLEEHTLIIEHWHSAIIISWLTTFLSFFLPGISRNIFKGVTVFFAQAFIHPSHWFFAAQKPSQRPMSIFPFESELFFSK